MATAATANSCASCGKAQAELAADLLRCSRCRSTTYCSKSCQTSAWPAHKAHCSPTIPSFSSPPSNTGLRRILVLELEDYSWLGGLYDNFFNELSHGCKVRKVSKLNDAVDAVGANHNAVILFEPVVMKQSKRVKYEAINNTLVAYARAGGTVIFGCQCSSTVRPPDLDAYFSTVWDLPWKHGNYARFDFQLKVPTVNGKALPTDYNAKAVQLRNVDADAVLYRQAGESQGILPTPRDEGPGSGPVVWQRYGDGFVAWSGDVNNEDDTRAILRIFCGI